MRLRRQQSRIGLLLNKQLQFAARLLLVCEMDEFCVAFVPIAAIIDLNTANLLKLVVYGGGVRCKFGE